MKSQCGKRLQQGGDSLKITLVCGGMVRQDRRPALAFVPQVSTLAGASAHMQMPRCTRPTNPQAVGWSVPGGEVDEILGIFGVGDLLRRRWRRGGGPGHMVCGAQRRMLTPQVLRAVPRCQERPDVLGMIETNLNAAGQAEVLQGGAGRVQLVAAFLEWSRREPGVFSGTQQGPPGKCAARRRTPVHTQEWRRHERSSCLGIFVPGRSRPGVR